LLSATADKVDHGILTFKATNKDHELLKPILENGFYEKPNYSHWVYKNRSGLNNCIIWSNMNLGTMREVPLFVTDTDFNLLHDVNPTEISYDSYVGYDREEETQNKETEVQETEISF